MEELINFELPAERSSIIKVLGVGGGGSNAVNHMFRQGIKDVNFVVCNTDSQALQNSPVTVKIQLGENLTEGRGAGSKPEIGRKAALESFDDLTQILSVNTKMVFITAGMGGGTGTGAAPVIARAARELGLLTVAIVTIPFRFEGQQRIDQAIQGINEIQQYVDSLLVINNEKLREMYGDLGISEAFSRADDVLATAAKGIAEIITVHGYINVDFADVETVMTRSGVALMGSGTATGEGRALKAIREALASPLLNNNDITGAKSILLNITSGTKEISMDEMGEITDFVHQSADRNALIIWGTGNDEKLGEAVRITVIATGFGTNSIPELYVNRRQFEKVGLKDESARPRRVVSPDAFEVRDKEPGAVQTSFEFNLSNGEDGEAFIISEDSSPKKKNPAADNRKREERVKILRDTHEKMKEEGYSGIASNDKIDELENQPAYLRKKVKLEEEGGKPTAENPASKYTLSEDENNILRLREDNSYLHDNVD